MKYNFFNRLLAGDTDPYGGNGEANIEEQHGTEDQPESWNAGDGDDGEENESNAEIPVSTETPSSADNNADSDPDPTPVDLNENETGDDPETNGDNTIQPIEANNIEEESSDDAVIGAAPFLDFPEVVLMSSSYVYGKFPGRQALTLEWNKVKPKEWDINPLLLNKGDNYDNLTLIDIYEKHLNKRVETAFDGSISSMGELRSKISSVEVTPDVTELNLLKQIEWQVMQYAIVDTLNPENILVYEKNNLGEFLKNSVSNARYASRKYLATDPKTGEKKEVTSTFCNVYAHDVVWALGGYLPRVFWEYTNPALTIRFKKGESVKPEFNVNVTEQNANLLSDWFNVFGNKFGWRSTKDVEEAQQEANNGRIVIIVASQKGSGHINVVLAEEINYDTKKVVRRGKYNAGPPEYLFLPLQTQAGAGNFNYSSDHLNQYVAQWWLPSDNKRYEPKGNFWILDSIRRDNSIYKVGEVLDLGGDNQ